MVMLLCILAVARLSMQALMSLVGLLAGKMVIRPGKRSARDSITTNLGSMCLGIPERHLMPDRAVRMMESCEKATKDRK